MNNQMFGQKLTIVGASILLMFFAFSGQASAQSCYSCSIGPDCCESECKDINGNVIGYESCGCSGPSGADSCQCNGCGGGGGRVDARRGKDYCSGEFTIASGQERYFQAPWQVASEGF